LANTFEAVVGAIYLEFGLEETKLFLEKTLFPYLKTILKNNLHRDPKSYFQEKAQEIYQTTPEYKTLNEDGPEHDKEYISGAYIGDKLIAKGKGSSKKNAEINAAANALIEKK
jgi:ribonuclease-3